jgi:hypothetical protein
MTKLKSICSELAEFLVEYVMKADGEFHSSVCESKYVNMDCSCVFFETCIHVFFKLLYLPCMLSIARNLFKLANARNLWLLCTLSNM